MRLGVSSRNVKLITADNCLIIVFPVQVYLAMLQTKLRTNGRKFLKYSHDDLFSTQMRRILMVKFLTFTEGMFIHLTQTALLEFKPFR